MSRLLRSIVLLLVPLALTGCLETAPSATTDFPIPPRFREARPVATTLSDQWWQAYRQRELNQLVADALADNLDIAAARARLLQAEALVTTSRAPLLPQITGNNSSGQRQTPGLTAPVTSGNFSLGVSGSWLIDLFGRNRALLESAQNSALAAQVNRDLAALTIAVSLTNSYFQLCNFQDRLAIAERNVATSSRVLNAIRFRMSAGTTSDLEVAQQESLTASQRASVPPLRQQIGQTRNIIAVLTGRTPESFQPKGCSLSIIAVPQVSPGLPSDLLQRRPDIKAAEFSLEALNANITAARAAFFPSISLTGSGNYASADLVQLIRPENFAYSIAGNIAQTIFDGGTLAGNLDNAKGRHLEALATYRKTILTAFADVENALIAQRETARQLQYQSEAQAAAQRAFRIADDRLAAGTVDIVTLLNIQQTLFQTQDSVAQARLARISASVSLYNALGGGWTATKNLPLQRQSPAEPKPE